MITAAAVNLMDEPVARPTTSAQSHIRYLQGIRGVAALLVVISHCGIVISSELSSISFPPFAPFQWTANFAVPTFITLSGYCLWMPVAATGELSGGTIAYWKRRGYRILPAFYAAFLVSWLIGAFITHATSKWSFFGWDFWGPALLVNDFIGSAHSYCVPLWSLPIEWHAYALLPVLLFAVRRRGFEWPATTLAALTLLSISALRRFGFYWAMPEFYTLFLAGVFAAWITHSPSARASQLRNLPWPQIAIACTSIFAAYCAGRGFRTFVSDPIPFELFWGCVMIAALTALFTSPSSTIRDLLASRIMFNIGEISYSLYLFHWPILTMLAIVVVRLHSWWALPALWLLGVPTSMLAALGSYYLFARPYLRGKASSRPR